MELASEYLYLPLFVLIFLLIDLLIEIESPRALLTNFYFWLYWFVYSIGTEVAFYIVGNATNPQIAALPRLLLALIAIVGTTTILQSLTFKVGGKKVLDLSHYLDDYRRKVLVTSAAMETRFLNRLVLRQSLQILAKIDYKSSDPNSKSEIKRIYADVMLFGRRDPRKVQQELEKAENDCAQTGASLERDLARRIAQADPEWVRNFLSEPYRLKQ